MSNRSQYGREFEAKPEAQSRQARPRSPCARGQGVARWTTTRHAGAGRKRKEDIATGESEKARNQEKGRRGRMVYVEFVCMTVTWERMLFGQRLGLVQYKSQSEMEPALPGNRDEKGARAHARGKSRDRSRTSSWSFMALMAAWAWSSAAKVTNPKPRERPVPGSLMRAEEVRQTGQCVSMSAVTT